MGEESNLHRTDRVLTFPHLNNVEKFAMCATPRASQMHILCAKSSKFQSLSSDSHSLGQAYLKITILLKINAKLWQRIPFEVYLLPYEARILDKTVFAKKLYLQHSK